MKTQQHFPIPEIPSTKELLLSLIREELKSRFFFDSLRELGLDESHYYQTDLSTLILTYVRLSPEPNEVVDFYYHLLGKHAHQLYHNSEAISIAADKVYKELMAFKEQQPSR